MSIYLFILFAVAMLTATMWHRERTVSPPNQFHADWPKPWHTPAW